MTDLTDWDDDISGEDNKEDTIIELADIVKEDDNVSALEDVIELIDIVEDGGSDLDLDIVKEDNLQDKLSFDQELELEIDGPDSIEPDLIKPDEFIEPGAIAEVEVDVQDFSVSQEQLEAALERVIEKKFADKIENILFEVMEKVIEKEITEIRDCLQKDLNEIGKV